MKRMIINGPGYCAVTEDGILVEYIKADREDRNGCILLGKVERMMPGLKCAFVDIGRKKNAFLPLDENSGSFSGVPVRSGQTLILQIKKEESGGKGAYLTRDIAIPGSCVIVMPMNRYIGVSNRIPDGEVRKRLKSTGTLIAEGKYGIVLRNAAADADDETIRKEAEMLLEEWNNIEKKAAEGGFPGKQLWYSTEEARIREDYAADGYETVTEETMSPEISRQLRNASERKLHLPGGGNIVIDRCEAMTVIDVNTASSRGEKTKEQTVLETNLEACAMIAQQVRLRNLGGIILIDFIDMNDEKDRGMVYEKLSKCFAKDRIKTVIHGWTKLGIMEMTRKRTGREMNQSEE